MAVNTQEREKRLKTLMENLTRGDVVQRSEATARLLEREKNGKTTLPMLISWSRGKDIPQVMYAIGALGRNQSPKALKQLLLLLHKHQNGNPLFVEVIVTALGDTGNRKAVSPLLRLLGVSTWRKLIKGKSHVIDLEKIPENRNTIRLAVIRALANIIGSKDARWMGVFLHDEDPLVRWHTIQLMGQSGCREFIKDIEHLAKHDKSEIVKEKADIALDEMGKVKVHSHVIN